VVNCGGIAEKNPLVMQIYATLPAADEDLAFGPDLRPRLRHRRRRRGGRPPGLRVSPEGHDGLKSRVFKPNPKAHEVYQQLYSLYRKLHDAFARKNGMEIFTT